MRFLAYAEGYDEIGDVKYKYYKIIFRSVMLTILFVCHDAMWEYIWHPQPNDCYCNRYIFLIQNL